MLECVFCSPFYYTSYNSLCHMCVTLISAAERSQLILLSLSASSCDAACLLLLLPAAAVWRRACQKLAYCGLYNSNTPLDKVAMVASALLNDRNHLDQLEAKIDSIIQQFLYGLSFEQEFAFTIYFLVFN